MKGFEEIQKVVENFINESKQLKKQIAEIERRRSELAQERNEKRNANLSNYEAEIDVLGKQISELGNQSQELQNKLDIRFNEVKKLVNLAIDNLITEGIRRVRKIDEERQELEEKVLIQEERNAKYEIQKQEFYERFGRVPELSENAKKEDEVQDKQCLLYKTRIEELEGLIDDAEVELVGLASAKRDFKNGNWSNVVNSKYEEKTEVVVQNVEKIEEESIVLPLMEEKVQEEDAQLFEEIDIEEFKPVEEIEIEEFGPIGEIEVEEFEPVQEIEIQEFKPSKEIEELLIEPFEEVKDDDINVQTIEEVQEEAPIDEIERIARAIVEEIVAEQTKELNIDKVEEKQEEKEQEIITVEEREDQKEEENVNNQVIEENITLLSIIAKIESGEVVYKAQASNGEEIEVYPKKTKVGNILLKEKEIKADIKEILINYAIAEHKTLDQKVIKKIDPIICEVLKEFAKKFKFDEKNLIYNYVMSFSKTTEVDDITPITYNFSYINGTNLSKTEKRTILKICKDATKNQEIDIIGCVPGFNKIKYVLRRLFATNNIKSLPEGKY